ncbi:MAG: Asp/Glu racemase [Rhodobacter sp.]|nr:Asp/Glu racemase [Rhodobacter sp.]
MAQPYRLTDRIGRRAALGLIVLQADETIEQDFRRLFTASDVAVYVSRVPSAADVTPETLAAMEAALPAAAALLPPSLEFDAVGYGCTTGATVIGPGRVEKLVAGACRARAVSDPLSAVLAAFQALGARRIGLVSPYIASVTAPLRAALAAAGLEVVAEMSFDEREEARVARIDPESIREAALRLGDGVEAVFLSCTNLRTLDVIDGIEVALDRPVVGSNQALAWHMAHLAGITADRPVGRLMAI